MTRAGTMRGGLGQGAGGAGGAALAAAALILGLGAACGPVGTASTVSDAERDLGEARTLEAPRRAPYEYTKAQTLLEKAKELEGHGFYESASALARQSRTMSEKAIDVARLASEREKRDEKFGVRKARPKADAGQDEGGGGR